MSLSACLNLTNSFSLIFKSKISHSPNINSKILLRKPVFYSGSIQGNRFLCYKGLKVVAFGAKNLGQGEDDRRALETVLKLYDAIRNRNKSELADTIGEECRCVCNFIAAYQPCYGKQQVLDFFANLMKNLGSNIQFVVEPTSHDGMNVGISWKLEWRKSGVPIGKGFSFYTCHVYQGKVMIRNVEMFMEPHFHVEPLILKFIGIMTNVIDKIGSNEAYRIKLKRIMYALLVFYLAIILLFFTRLFS